MKKHHLFLLIVSLLLVAALAFPAPVQKSTVQPVIYNAFNMDEIPAMMVCGDTLHIKQCINPFSDIEKVEVGFEVFLKVPGKQDTSIPYNKTPILMKGEEDDQPEPYYEITFPHPGTYIIRFMPSSFYQNKPPCEHVVEVISPTDKTGVRKIRDGEDGI